MTDLLLGIDVGTSSTKAVVCDLAGRVLGTASAPHPSYHPHPGWSEQEPMEWWGSTVQSIRQVMAGIAGRVVGVGLSGQMHGSVLLNADRKPVRRALMWNDQRTSAECEEIERVFGGRAELVRRVGNAALTGFTLPKLLWVRRHEAEIWKQVRSVVLPKDFIRLKLTGELATDVGDASGILLFDVDKRIWSSEAMGLVELDSSLFPRAFESGEVAGRISKAAAAETGLPEGIPVVGGSGDNQAGAVGAGVVSAGLVLATIGTSGVIYAHSERARKDLGTVSGRLHTMCAANGGAGNPGQWSITGCMLSAGGSLQWCRDALFPGVEFEALMREAEAVAPGCDGLVFLPYLTGERCPHPDPKARGGWIGLTTRHTRGHLVRAVIEGVTFGMGQILGLVRGLGVRVEKARLGGGGARSALWRQMQADVYGCPVALTNTEEGPAYGAALLAGVGAGVFASAQAACDGAIEETMVIEPRRSEYGAARRVYESLYGDLRARFGELLAVEQGEK